MKEDGITDEEIEEIVRELVADGMTDRKAREWAIDYQESYRLSWFEIG